MQIVEVIEGPDKGYFMIQKKKKKKRLKRKMENCISASN